MKKQLPIYVILLSCIFWSQFGYSQSTSKKITSEIGMEVNGEDTQIGIGLTYSLYYYINDYIRLGASAGFRNHNIDNRRNFIPITFTAKNSILGRRSGPYIRTDVGYGYALSTEEAFSESAKGGLIINPSLGYERYTSANMNFHIEVGLLVQYATYEGLDMYGNLNKSVKYKRGVLRMGIGF